jgi:hypothetical protein
MHAASPRLARGLHITFILIESPLHLAAIDCPRILQEDRVIMLTKKTSVSPSKRNLLWDALLLAGSLLALSPHLTGLSVHEWLSAGLGLAILIHLLWHWEWIVAVLRRVVSRLAASARLNLILNLILFAAFTVSLFSGMMISHSILPALGLEAQRGGAWKILHTQSSDLVLVLLALHLALHWKWILRNLRNLVRLPEGQRIGHAPASRAAAVPVPVAAAIRDEVRR